MGGRIVQRAKYVGSVRKSGRRHCANALKLKHPGHQRLQFTPIIFVPFARTSTTLARAFSVVGPSAWNGLPLSQRLLPRILSDTFYSSLKTLLFSRARVGSASE